MVTTKTYSFSQFIDGLDLPRINYEIDHFQKLRSRRKSTSIDNNAQTVTFEFWTDLVTETNSEYPNTDETYLNEVVTSHCGKALIAPTVSLGELKDRQGLLRVTLEPRVNDTEFLLASHDLTKPWTWFYHAQHYGPVQLDTEDGYTYTSGTPNWIDLESGLVLREDWIQQYYPIVILVDGYQVSRQVFSQDEGDFIVNCPEGSVTFKENMSGHMVHAYFAAATTSDWYFRPRAGKILRLEDAEVQFSTDIEYNDTIIMEIRTDPSGTGDYSLIKDTRIIHKSLGQILDEARGCYPQIPAVGGAERGLTSTIIGFPLRIGEAVILDSSTNDEIRLYLQNHRPFGGSKATITFYGTELGDYS